MTPYGISQDEWHQAKDEMRLILIAVARSKSLIAYSDLVAKVLSVQFEAHDPRLDDLLCEISTEEDTAGRGLLSVVVVHKSGDKKPGRGFFALAKSRGRGTEDEIQCWVEQLQQVYSFWSS